MYQVQFVGLMCFYKQGGDRLVMLPDATMSSPAHRALIAVPSGTVLNHTWPAGEFVDNATVAEFLLKPSMSVSLEVADQPGAFDKSKHDGVLLNLHSVNTNFSVNAATAMTVATVPIKQGTLTTFLHPHAVPDLYASIISQLDVPHGGQINVVATLSNGTTQRMLLKPGTEILIVNQPIVATVIDHFHMFEMLGGAGAPPLGTTPPNANALGLKPSASQHPFFKQPIVNDTRCPNTGCC